MRPSTRSLFRFSALVAAGHFLVYQTLLGLALIAPRARGSRNAVAEAVLFPATAVFMLPAGLLPFHGPGVSPMWIFPPGAAIPVAFCSLVWSLTLTAVWFAARRLIRYRPSARFVQIGRILILGFGVLFISWLFFGPVSGFAGDLMFGILDAGRHMDGQFSFRPSWLIISGVLWALSIFAVYRFVFVPPQRVHPLQPNHARIGSKAEG